VSLASAIEGIQDKLATAFPKFGVNTCRLIVPSSTPDGYGGTTEILTTVASSVPVNYEARANPIQRQIGGGPMVTLGHDLTLPATAQTEVIRSHYMIIVDAVNDQPELTFRNPVTLDGSFSVFVELAAELAE
jgi:hypothetical protein